MIIENLVLPDNIIRDWKDTRIGTTAGVTLDSRLQEAITLDLYIRNRGAAAITVSIEGQGALTIDPGDVININGEVMGLIVVTATAAYDLRASGVKYSTLKRRGLI